MLTVERLPDGEASTYLADELRPGDVLELRGPIGGYFVWKAGMGGPLLLVAGGSGIVTVQNRAATTDGRQIVAQIVQPTRLVAWPHPESATSLDNP